MAAVGDFGRVRARGRLSLRRLQGTSQMALDQLGRRDRDRPVDHRLGAVLVLRLAFRFVRRHLWLSRGAGGVAALVLAQRVDRAHRGGNRCRARALGQRGDPASSREKSVASELPTAGADFSSAWSDFKALGAFFCNSATLSFLRLVGRSRAWSVARPCTTSCGFAASEPYHFRARIQSFQAVAAPFPGDSILPSRPLAPRSPATETPRFKRSTIRLDDLRRGSGRNKYRTTTQLWQEIC